MTTTREKILDAAQKFIQTRTYHGFSYSDIAEEVGINKASIYHYFGSKDDVALQVVRRNLDYTRDVLSKCAGQSCMKQLETYFGIFREIGCDGDRLCTCGSFAAVWDAVSPSVREEIGRFTQYHLDWLTQLVQRGRRNREFRKSGLSAKADAQYIFSCMQGSVLTGRLADDSTVITAVTKRIARSMQQ